MEYVLLTVMTLVGALASVLFKKAANKATPLAIITSANLYFGGLLYLCAALVNIYLLTLMDLSKVLPLTSITYIWTIMLAKVIFGERVGWRKVVGVLFIVAGAALISL